MAEDETWQALLTAATTDTAHSGGTTAGARAAAAAAAAKSLMPLGCSTDHSRERRLFEASAEDQIAMMAKAKNLGSVWYREGQYARAAERYRRALVVYEYAFPEDGALQAKLDTLRVLACLSLAACELRMHRYRDAVQHAGEAMASEKYAPKARYRRAQAWRALGDFVAARQDLQAALAAAPQSLSVRREALALASAMRKQRRKEVAAAKAMFGADVDDAASCASVSTAPSSIGGASCSSAMLSVDIGAGSNTSSSDDDAELAADAGPAADDSARAEQVRAATLVFSDGLPVDGKAWHSEAS